MTAWICATCGVQHADTASPPAGCAICLDERQYVPPGGQRWTSLDQLRDEGRRSDLRELEPDLLGIGVSPGFGIGQRALLLRSEGRGLLWDIPGYLDDEAVARVRDFCSVVAISASHPHFYGVIAEWSARLGGVPVLLPEADLRWVQRPDAPYQAWAARHEVLPGVTLLQCGGHFPGSAVVHWSGGAAGRGALLTGDTISVASDRSHVSFMRSFPNYIPLGAPQVQRITAVLESLAFDRIYGGWWDSVVTTGAKAAVSRSAERYLHWVGGRGQDA